MFPNLVPSLNQITARIKQTFTRHETILDSIRGKPGYLYHVTGDPLRPLGAQPLLNYNPIIVDTDAEAQVHLGEEESFANVFNNWRRISHLRSLPQPANPGELDSWELDPETNNVKLTVNSGSLVGFISPDAHDHYTFEVTLSSDDTAFAGGDDDLIGVCLAFTVVNGIEHTIVAMRTPGGAQTHPSLGGSNGRHRAKLLDVYADIFHGTRRRDLGSTNGGLMWGDGIVDDDRVPEVDIQAGGWNAHPEGCRLRITRTGDHFKVETTNLGSDVYVPSATVEFTLNDDPTLAKFKGPQRYGYVAFSQARSTWVTHAKPAAQSQIIVLGSPTSYEWQGDGWVSGISTQQLIQNLDKSRFYYNRQTRKLYYAFASGFLRRIRGLL